MAVKSLSKSDVEKVMANLEKSLKMIAEKSNSDHYYAHSMALGVAESTIEHTLKQLKGEYPIL